MELGSSLCDLFLFLIQFLPSVLKSRGGNILATLVCGLPRRISCVVLVAGGRSRT